MVRFVSFVVTLVILGVSNGAHVSPSLGECVSMSIQQAEACVVSS